RRVLFRSRLDLQHIIGKSKRATDMPHDVEHTADILDIGDIFEGKFFRTQERGRDDRKGGVLRTGHGHLSSQWLSSLDNKTHEQVLMLKLYQLPVLIINQDLIF